MGADLRILVTGSTGQVGCELVRSLDGLGVIAAPTRVELDLAQEDGIRRFVRDFRPTLVINPAAYTTVDKAESEPEVAFAINAMAPRILAEEALRAGAAMIHYSTDYVFDGEKTSPYVEDDPASPKNVYGRTKLDGERAVQASGVPHLILRTSWVYGSRGSNFLLTMLRLAHEQPTLRIVADQIGAPTWSRTIAELSAAIVAQAVDSGSDPGTWIGERSGVYHLTAHGSASWADFAEAIFDEAALTATPHVERITTAEFPRPAPRPLNSRLSGAKLQTKFGVTPPDWREALRACLSER